MRLLHLHRDPSETLPMMGSVAPAAPVAPAGPAGTAGTVLVTVAPTLLDRLPGLQAELGRGYAVEAGTPTADALAILRAPSPATLAFWRARYPGAWLLVVDPGMESDATTCLNAGADAYVAGPVSTVEVAAVLRSLDRRRGAALLPA